MKKTTDIPQLIAKKVIGDTLSPTEETCLLQWLEKEDNRRLYDEISRLGMTAQILKLEHEHYGEYMVKRFIRSRKQMIRTNLYRKLRPWLSVAAAILLLIFIPPLFLEKRQSQQQVSQNQNTTITPGETKATLTLTGGESFLFNENNKQDVKRLIDSMRVISQVLDKKETPSKVAYNTLTIPRGADFFFELEDGTKVWMNSESELRFPEKFIGNERQVYLKGEAFFEVTPSKGKPFVVSTGKGDIRVYGTRFNLTNYTEKELSAVLVEGKVSFRATDGKETDIQPSQRLTYDRERNQTKVETVDVSLYTAWVDKHFIFNGQTLEEILSTLSRWYNFNFIFHDDALRTIRLSGRLYRYDDINILLDSYRQIADIEFHIKGKNIVITNNH